MEEIINDLCITFCKVCNMLKSELEGNCDIEMKDLENSIEEWNYKVTKYLESEE